MNGNGVIKKAVAGFSEGLILLPIEMVVAILITMVLTVQQVTSQITTHDGGLTSTFNIPLMLGLFAVMNIAESLVIGIGDMVYAFSYIVGAVISLFLFASVITSAYPDAVSATVGVIIIVIVGIILKIVMISKRSQ
jgi:hypothetical protein